MQATEKGRRNRAKNIYVFIERSLSNGTRLKTLYGCEIVYLTTATTKRQNKTKINNLHADTCEWIRIARNVVYSIEMKYLNYL